MLERPPGGTTMRLPAGLMGMSSGVGGPAKRERDKIKRPKISVGGAEKQSQRVQKEDICRVSLRNEHIDF